MTHTSLWAAIESRAAASPDGELMVDERGRRMTYARFRDAAEATAAFLYTHGLGEGDTVTWQLPTWIESVVLVGALARLGVVQNPVMPIYRERELAFVTKQTGASLLVVPPQWRGFDYPELARRVRDRVHGLEVLVVDGRLPTGDPAVLPPPPAVPATPADAPVRWYFYTSGTTADPKGARHTDASIMAAGVGMADRIGAVAGDRVALVFPFAHIGGCTTWLTAALTHGVTLILTEAFHPEETPALLRRERVTLAGAGTVFHQTWLAAQRRRPAGDPLFPELRSCPGGGAPKPPGLHHDVKKELGGAGILAGWGLTEAPILTMAGPGDSDDALAHAEGRPTHGVELSVVGPDDAVLPLGAEGELRATGPQLMRGYVDAALDADAFDAAGRLRTGDLGRVDAAGNVYITGRLKDVILRKGETISAKEVEDLLSAHPAIAEVTVIGLPDPERGEMVCAVIVPADPSIPPNLRDIGDYLSGRELMRQKFPERVEIVPVLPRNPAGKVLKNKLKERYA
ncbi:class I adenylate-forming enzyme family protein [Embleya sp. NBC_00896]|uniref:class I adenylate-forming enzyme family protein n=1 Tax=Embleya sp. NBC_00896 TaxID=2975961 RepID=UPI00386819FB|nr:AMP-binding protein [Embleya sp. NBC_00896]